MTLSHWSTTKHLNLVVVAVVYEANKVFEQVGDVIEEGEVDVFEDEGLVRHCHEIRKFVEQLLGTQHQQQLFFELFWELVHSEAVLVHFLLHSQVALFKINLVCILD